MATVTEIKTIEELPENASPSSTDYVLTATKSRLKRSTVSQLKDGMGLTSGYKLTAATRLTFTSGSDVAASSSKELSQSFDKKDGATLFVPVVSSEGWGNVSSVSITDNTLSLKLINTTSSARTLTCAMYVLQYAPFYDGDDVIVE